MLTMTLLIGLATYRVWRLIATDNILDGPRDKFVYWLQFGGRVREWLDDLIFCVWCLGFWIAGGMTATAALLGGFDWGWANSLVVWFAASAVAGFAGRLDPSS